MSELEKSIFFFPALIIKQNIYEKLNSVAFLLNFIFELINNFEVLKGPDVHICDFHKTQIKWTDESTD